VLDRIRPRLTYANVVATLALFIALGGSSYAAITITGKNVKNSSLTWRDLQRNTLGGTRIKESRLGTVPRANRAELLGGLRADQLLVRCPDGTRPVASVCVETAARGPVSARPAGGDYRHTESYGHSSAATRRRRAAS